jgi:hypothetical protein
LLAPLDMVTILLNECLAAIKAKVLLEKLGARIVYWQPIHPLIPVGNRWVLREVRQL